LATSGKWIADVSSRAGADGTVVHSLALSLNAASVVTWVDTLEVVARAVISTITVVSTLASCAFLQWVSPGTGGTETHWPVGSGPVVAGSALGSVAARVGLTEIGLGESPA